MAFYTDLFQQNHSVGYLMFDADCLLDIETTVSSASFEVDVLEKNFEGAVTKMVIGDASFDVLIHRTDKQTLDTDLTKDKLLIPLKQAAELPDDVQTVIYAKEIMPADTRRLLK